MKKTIKNLFLGIFIFISFLIFTSKVNANTINSIEMDVYIDSNGLAIITETWNAYLNQGTEGYRPYTNLGNSLVSNFSVSDETGITYESLSNWNTSSSFNAKAYKNGINYISNGVELCWGISKYGNKTYTLKYDISNFITQYTDTQGIYFNFINLDQRVENAKITIHSDYPFSLDNTRIWAFGNNGTINFENGNIVLNSNGSLSPSQYMVALVRFETNLFKTTNTSIQSFDEIYDSAMDGISDEELNESYINNSLSFIEVLLMLISIPLNIICRLFFNPIIWLILIVVLNSKKSNNTYNLNNNLDFGTYGKILPSDDKINYFREIPCNKDLERAYWVAFQYNVVSTSTLREGIIGAILLKWFKEEKITISKTKNGLFNFKDNDYAIDFSNIQEVSNKIENQLLQMLKKASGSNSLLEAKEFEKWCKKNHGQIQSWFYLFNAIEQEELEKQGLLTSVNEEKTVMFGKKKTVTIKKVNLQLREDAIQLKGLKKFLLDFSKMPERNYYEVHIWEEYLIFASLLGIADKVEEQFSKLYPKFKEESTLNLDFTTPAIRNIAYLGYKGYEAGRKAASRSHSSHSYSGSSRSSGGGGSSFSSGGRSSGGSSGGGFR